MLGRIIIFLIILIYIFVANAHDFDNLLNHGENDYIQRYPGVLATVVVLMTIPMLVFDLRGTEGIITLIILEVAYITIYTLVYFRIKKQKEEIRNDKYGRRNNKK